MKNYITGIMMCLLLSAFPTVAVNALADVNAVQTGERTVEVEVVINDADEAVDFVLQVFAPGKSQADLVSGKPAENMDVIVWNKQGVTDDEGRFKEEFALDGVSGDYIVRLYNGKDKKIDNNAASFWFTDINSFKKLMKDLNSAAKAGTAEEFVLNKQRELVIFDTKNISIKNLADIIEAEVKIEEFDTESYENCSKKADVINFIGLLNEKKIENIFEYNEVFEQIDEYVAFAKKNSYFENEARAKALTEKLSGKDIVDSKDLAEKLASSIILVIAEKPDGIDNVKDAVEEFGDIADVDTGNASYEKIYSVCGKKYDTIDDFNRAVKKADSGQSKGGSSGGGGGSSSGTATKGKITNADEVLKNEEIQSIPSDVFTDLDDAIWARNAIVSLTDKGYLRGRADGIFAPNENILREEFVKILVQAFDNGSEIDETAKLSFTDTDEDEWYYPYLQKAVSRGLVKGYSDEFFGIGECITRQDMAVMIYRAMETDEVATADVSEQFSDFDDVADYATDAVSYFVEKGIMNGMGDGTLKPENYTTRAEAAKVIYEVIRR